jgi:hypothetical protein
LKLPDGTPSLAHHFLATTFVLMMFWWATPAQADPCEGRLPSDPGQKFEGLIRCA